MAARIQLRRAKGWRKPESAVVVARPSRWGNPFTVAEHGAETAVSLYRSYLDHNAHLAEEVRRELAGRDLACWCPLAAPCHADVLIAMANTPAPTTPRDTACLTCCGTGRVPIPIRVHRRTRHVGDQDALCLSCLGTGSQPAT